MTDIRRYKRRQGFSLIELLIAMTLGLILTLGMIKYFSESKRNSDLNTAMIDMQESARYAVSALSQRIRLSGYQGCLDVNRGEIAIQSKNAPTTGLRASATVGSVVVSDTEWSPSPPPDFNLPLPFPAIVGTHALSVQFAGADTGRLIRQMSDENVVASPAGALHIDRDLGFKVGDHAVVASCDTADLFTVSDISVSATGNGNVEAVLGHKASHNVSGNLTRAYGDSRTNRQTRVMRFNSNVYYVGDTGLTNEQGDRITALYQRTLPFNDATNPPTEVVQGVENMRLAFGIREAGGNLRYVTATDPAFDAARVEVVQIGLLMTSWDRIADVNDEKTYRLVGDDITPASSHGDGSTFISDKRMRLAFHGTVKVRNRRNSL